jgi:predicted pyridoxine 5'-phosphate oxidase superfamily flavin-nucleotide-binding protein
MIPERLVAFVHGPTLSWVGTRDARLRPSVSWAFGARVSPDRDEITVFIPDIEAEQTKRNADQNRLIAFTVVDGTSHEAYQFKGKLVGLRPTNEEERAVQDIHRSKVISYIAPVIPHAKGLFDNYRLYPSTALTFRVEQAFIQTPGPDAGKRLDLSTLQNV